MIKAQDLLHETANTLDERGKSYSHANDEAERNMNNIVKAFNAMTGRDLSEVEGWLFMVALKATRAGRGGNPGLDSFRDLVGYAALAGECYAKG